MKKLICALLTMMCSILYCEYQFEIKNPYSATILGSIDGISEVNKKIPTKDYTIKLSKMGIVPKNLWYHKEFKFSLVSQKKPAPLVFLLAGTGSSYNSYKMKKFQAIFYNAGYHVLSISSPINSNFMVAGSSSKLPGILMEDGMDIYNIMTAAYNKIKSKIKVTDFHLVGYSLGGTEAAFVSYIDDEKHTFNFKRVYMINPAVDLHTSALLLDSFLGAGSIAKQKIAMMLDFISHSAPSIIGNEYSSTLTEEAIYNIFQNLKLSDDEMKGIIGLAFRISSIDLNYITDVLNNKKIYIKYSVKKFENTLKYFQRINYATFEDYLNKIMIPTLKSKHKMTVEQIRESLFLGQIKDYLKTTDKIVVVTNEDELILTKENIQFLKDTFDKRLILFPRGGHCGNMYFSENVELMLNYLGNGEFRYENK
ncbi:MAG: alpha/beta hydrolase [Fusobacteriaceae bacterium]|jgi:hypothetical protein|nr:alpha/beta hydrolase [Fusobacteriaceae bacterium]